MNETKDLKLLIESRTPIIFIESNEEPRALDMIKHIGVRKSLPVHSWAVTTGLARIDFGDLVRSKTTMEPEAALFSIQDQSTPGIYVFCDLHPFLSDNPKIVRLLKEIAMQKERLNHTIILLSHSLIIPPEIKTYVARLRLSLPNEEQLLTIIKEEALNWSKANDGQRVKTDKKTLDQLVGRLKGLSFSDARRLAVGAICNDGAITDSDIPAINKAKYELMDWEGVLRFEYDTASFSDVGGLANLKEWLGHRREAFLKPDTENVMDTPKGIMLLGVQGGGKSLAAKAVAGLWNLPLLRLDMAALFNKFIGESEKNMREALQMAETMSPCVLWMDEVEKGVSMDSNDGGASRRMVGTLLTWMAERKQPVFTVMTANDVQQLPPELIRKGRLDEIFFVDLPNPSVRELIFSIHLRKRDLSVDDFCLSSLASASEGFSGAEIEQAVVSALYTAAAQDETVDSAHVVDALASTSPLSVVMSEKMLALRAWAADRTVPAHD